MAEPFDWMAPLKSLPGVGDKTAEKLARLQLYTAGDLLLHFPDRYQDRTHLTPIVDILPEQYVVIQGNIIEIKVTAFRQKKRCQILLADKSGSLQILFFHLHQGMMQKWQRGVTLRCFGQVKLVKNKLQLMHPECEIIENELIEMPRFLTPIYPLGAGLTQSWFRRTIAKVLESYKRQQKENSDIFSEMLAPQCSMLSWLEALAIIHQPTPECNALALSSREHPAYQRLITEELFIHHVSMQKIKAQLQAQSASSLQLTLEKFNHFMDGLSFSLTSAQQKVWREIEADLNKTTPMLRLVQGDVGCGKTVIAALSAFAAVSNQSQVALMVPTEILAEQHYQQFCIWFEMLGVRCDLITGKLKAKAKRLLNENIQLGLSHIVIGTHALFQESIKFHRLGLVIIDEQHRFGVHQRFSLQEKGLSSLYPSYPHQLIMTATPIPRTLAMSHYAHLDISTIDALPPGRKPITTLTIPQSRREEIIARILKVCENQSQVYWVCTLISSSEILTCQAAEEVAEELTQSLSEYGVGLVHGKMKPEEKELVMDAFYQGKIKVLVATTVIEVGVNVPTATLMVIENPERLGLSQLHQLRGRVGRGDKQSYCVLLYQSPCSEMAQARLRIMRESQDGFVIAQADLALRGPGEMLGTKQTGAVQFKVADLKRDEDLLHVIPLYAKQLRALPSTLLEDMIQRWCPTTHYFQT